MEFTTKEFKIPCFIGIAGAIMLIVSVFITWLTPDVIGDSITGLKILTDGGDIKYGFAIIVALITGILALVVMIAPLFIVGDDVAKIYNVLAIALIVLSVVFLILGALFATQSIHSVKLTDVYQLGSGYVLAMVGGGFTLFGGVMHFVRKKIFR